MYAEEDQLHVNSRPILYQLSLEYLIPSLSHIAGIRILEQSNGVEPRFRGDCAAYVQLLDWSPAAVSAILCLFLLPGDSCSLRTDPRLSACSV